MYKALCILFILHAMDLFSMNRRFSLQLNHLRASSSGSEDIEIMPDSPDYAELVKAARDGSVKELCVLITDASQSDKNLALLKAAENIDYVVCLFLIKHGAKADAYDHSILTAVINTLIKENKQDLKLVKLLLEHRAFDVDDKNLVYAVKKRRGDIVALLTSYKKSSGE